MKDLTQDSIVRHVLRMAGPIAIGMIFQTLYYLVDLYFISRLGDAALAGASAAGNAAFLVLALTQVLGVGTVALISHAAGRKDPEGANLIFNQALGLALACGLLVLIAGYVLAPAYMSSLAADRASARAGTTYLYWFTPSLALQFALVVMGSALRGTGIVQPTMTVQVATVVLNALLAPVLVAGWGTGLAMGVAGAGLASSLATVVGVIALGIAFQRLQQFVRLDRRQLRPRFREWWRMLTIGLPAGGEFALMFLYSAVVYWTLRAFGADAQAGFGVGWRIMYVILLPAMAIAFAAGPVAGQNFGARRTDRVQHTFRASALLITAIMVPLTLLVHWRPDLFIGAFVSDARVLAMGALFLQLISWNFVAQGLIFTCSNLFQGLGNTKPALLSSAVRFVAFALPVLWLAGQPGFRIEQVWYLTIGSVMLQALVSLFLLRVEFRRRLLPLATAVS